MSTRLEPTEPSLLLPPQARLLHAGLPKTGTTALQHSASAQRAELLRQGVRYPGKGLNHRKAGLVFAERVAGWRTPDQAAWLRLVQEVRDDHDSRVWLSNENLAELPADVLRGLVDQLGGEVHAVLTLRSLPALLTSSWSQYLKTGLRSPFDRWVEAVLAPQEGEHVTPSFHRRNDLAALVRTWVDVVGADRLTLVVLDPADRARVPTAFESLLGLAPGTLAAVPLTGGDTNRSFTVAEAELVRRLNERVHAREDLDWSDYHRFVRKGAVNGLLRRTPDPGEPRIVPPRWAVERSVELAEGHRAAVEALDVRVVGDLAGLATPVPAREQAAEVPGLPVDAAVEALMACLEAGRGASPAPPAAPPAVPPAPARGLDGVPAAVLARTLARRVAGRARRAVRGRG